MSVDLIINGRALSLAGNPEDRLLDVLRANGFTGAKQGCHQGSCGACTILMDGRPVLSCVMMAGQAVGRALETVEGLGDVDHPHPLQLALVDEGAVQCGFCTPGVLMSAKALLEENPEPSEAEIKAALEGNLCRCTGYVKIVRGVQQAAKVMREAE